MTNSYEECLLLVTQGIIRDAERTFPKDRIDFRRDFRRISLLVESRGITVFTLDFPALLKHFDKCLSAGTYTRSKLSLGRAYSNRTSIPRIFKGLMLRVFNEDGLLKASPDTDAIFFIRQLYAVGKKIGMECQERKKYEAVNDFYTIEDSLPQSSLDWNEEYLRYSALRDITISNYHRNRSRSLQTHSGFAGDPDLLAVCQQVADILATTLGEFNPYEWMPKHGPGAVSDKKKGDYKYNFSSWSDRLEAIFPYADFAFANYGMWADALKVEQEFEGVDYSRLICVPKTQKGPRLIASEPTQHQWCQQVIWSYLDNRTSSTWIGKFIHFRDQTYNQRAAAKASESGKYWTVDLSAASDRVTTRLVERIFRKNPSLLSALHATRTGYIHQDIDNKCPPRHKLKKYTTMGSACTFPIESHIFLIMAISALLYTREIKPSIRNIESLAGEINIFGDDIIIPSDAGQSLVALLSYTSFEVNEDKTHTQGFFRESCGMEAYKGVDVTPAYVTTVPRTGSPESIIASVAGSNNFFRKGLFSAAEALKDLVGLDLIPHVRIGSGAFGWESYTLDSSRLRTRWNKVLHRVEYRALVMKSKARRISQDEHGPLLQYFTEKPDPLLKWSSGSTGRSKSTLRPGWVMVDDSVS